MKKKKLIKQFYCMQTKYGDIYDCVDFYKQPAFDHPLLKNHNFHHEVCFKFDFYMKTQICVSYGELLIIFIYLILLAC